MRLIHLIYCVWCLKHFYQCDWTFYEGVLIVGVDGTEYCIDVMYEWLCLYSFELPCWDPNMHHKATRVGCCWGLKEATQSFYTKVTNHLECLVSPAPHCTGEHFSTVSTFRTLSSVIEYPDRFKKFKYFSPIFHCHWNCQVFVVLAGVMSPSHGYLRAFLRWNILNGFTLSHF